jgi:death-on-curing protein
LPTNPPEIEPVWLTRVAVDVIHHDQLVEHGGLAGTRDENALEAGLARPRNRWLYEGTRDLADLAATSCYGLARSQSYIDGNKRVAFIAMAAFLELNGHALTARGDDVVRVMRDVAAGATSEVDLAAWITVNVDEDRR